MLILETITVTYRFRTDADPEEVERVHRFHSHYCPVFRSLSGSIRITTELEIDS